MNYINILLISVFFNFYSCSNPSTKNASDDTILSVETDSISTDKLEKSDSYWKEKLTKEQYSILRKKGTERPFTHPYNKNKKEGVYECAACNNRLFNSTSKFNSGTGWPSFWEPFLSKSIEVGADNSLGMSRDEVVCSRCDGHLGHVFNDGPEPTGLRYCINGESLNFKEKEIKVVFAQGCFWCVEEIFESIKGVKEVVSGYSGGIEKDPTYKQVGSGITSHAEAIEVTYNPTEVSYEELLKVYFNSGDITQVNGQGNDKGRQYRSIIFYTSKEQKQQIEGYLQRLKISENYTKIAIEIVPFKKFYKAEEYHQDYVKHNPNDGYVKAVSIPRFEKAIKNFPELLK